VSTVERFLAGHGKQSRCKWRWVRSGEGCRESALRFGELCQYDLFRGNSAEFANEADLGHYPNDPFGRIDLPEFHSIPVVILKLVVIVMIPFAEGKDCEERRVASTAF
jgi:hypothetical protein